MAKKMEMINGCEYEFVKAIPSDTKVKGSLVKVDGENYAVLSCPIPRLYNEISVYKSSRTGRPNDLGDPMFKFRGDDLQKGIDALLEMIGNAKPKTENK